MSILKDSILQLNELKVHKMVEFFHNILDKVARGVEQDVKDFLDPMKHCILRGEGSYEVEDLHIGKATKRVGVLLLIIGGGGYRGPLSSELTRTN